MRKVLSHGKHCTLEPKPTPFQLKIEQIIQLSKGRYSDVPALKSNVQLSKWEVFYFISSEIKQIEGKKSHLGS